MDQLADGSAWLDRQRAKFMTRPVTYMRENQSVEIRATIGKTVFKVDAGYGHLERLESHDYLVQVSDLNLAGVLLLPQTGDRIREVDPTLAFVYEVMAPGHEPVYRYSDPYRRTFRIHTKLVATEPNP